jgi:hypothetical protein
MLDMLLRRRPRSGWQQQLNSTSKQQHSNATLRAPPYCRTAPLFIHNTAVLANARESRGAAEVLNLAGRTCAIVWDLDNVCPRNPRNSLMPAIQEVKSLLFSFRLDHEPAVTCYGNTVTARALGEQRFVAGSPLRSNHSCVHLIGM